MLLVLACAVLIERLLDDRTTRRFTAAACAAIFGYHAVWFVAVYWSAKRENDARIALLRGAAPNTVAIVPPYRRWDRSRWFWGDDFQYASLREYVANEVYDLNGIEYDRPLHWAEPTPPDRFVAALLPLAFAIGAGSQMLQHLAIAVIGGVLISMVLSLIIWQERSDERSRHPSPPILCGLISQR